MPYYPIISKSKNLNPNWITIKEAIKIVNNLSGKKIERK